MGRCSPLWEESEMGLLGGSSGLGFKLGTAEIPALGPVAAVAREEATVRGKGLLSAI